MSAHAIIRRGFTADAKVTTRGFGAAPSVPSYGPPVLPRGVGRTIRPRGHETLIISPRSTRLTIRPMREAET